MNNIYTLEVVALLLTSCFLLIKILSLHGGQVGVFRPGPEKEVVSGPAAAEAIFVDEELALSIKGTNANLLQGCAWW